jgi:hypothetical protein
MCFRAVARPRSRWKIGIYDGGVQKMVTRDDVTFAAPPGGLPSAQAPIHRGTATLVDDV